VGDSALTLPIHVKKNIGLSLWPLIVGAAIVALSQLAPIVGGHLSFDAMLQGSAIYIVIGISAFCVFLYFFLRNPSQLTIDHAGVTLLSGKTRSIVAWPDIARVTPTNGQVRIEIKGRPEEEGVLISDGFGLKANQLTTVIRDGVARWGAAPSGDAFASPRSVSPEGGGKAAALAGMRRATLLMGFMALAMIIGMTIWQIADYAKSVQLEKHGVRTNAEVVRIYTADCSRDSCSLNVEYTYTTPSVKTLHGFGYLAREENSHDPDYLYAKSHRTIPIVFDANHPETSALNFNDRVFRPVSLVSRLEFIVMILGLLLAGFGAVLVPLLIALRWQIRKAARASAAA